MCFTGFLMLIIDAGMEYDGSAACRQGALMWEELDLKEQRWMENEEISWAIWPY
jgi:hypothetical protein